MTSTIEERLHIPRYVVLSLLAAFVIMAIFALIASQNPDGLERMFEAIGVESAEGGFLGFEIRPFGFGTTTRKQKRKSEKALKDLQKSLAISTASKIQSKKKKRSKR